VMKIEVNPAAAMEIALRSRGTPRVAIRLLKRVRDVAAVSNHPLIDASLAKSALEMLSIDHAGLDEGDRKLLRALIELFAGGPVGLATLAAALNEEQQTVEDIYEPFLIRKGLIERTPRGRRATPTAFEYLGLSAPAGYARQMSLLEGTE